ncbi:RNA polymerase sigma factor [Cryobacterium sp. RTC2.1]|uniref:RNA polymerase sigma factor n=1 Tax=Cryobacterium sp. RTC2.1 TaxID=3048634 RepID=UPI002B22C771|nr:RNA polymerase sigma factor [Cryobacterium sp. RTC2.1]MEB0004014.1 RNA polymerase sigma factor [Cryobacterium sp. RTC2.1]
MAARSEHAHEAPGDDEAARSSDHEVYVDDLNEFDDSDDLKDLEFDLIPDPSASICLPSEHIDAQRHGAMLLRYAFNLVENHHDAEDLVQRAAIKVWRCYNTTPMSDGSYKGLMITAVNNLFRDDLRKSRRQRDNGDWGDGFYDPVGELRPIEETQVVGKLRPFDELTGPESRAARREIRDHVTRSLVSIPNERQRAIAYLTFIDGLTQTEIAMTLDVTVETVKTHRRYALKYMRADLDDGRLDEYRNPD